MTYRIREIHNVSRPGHTPAPGDTVEIECVGGFVMMVDPVTRTASTTRRARFVLGQDGKLETDRDSQKVA